MDVMNITKRNNAMDIDVSTFFQFEVTGDSESCSNSDSGSGESSVVLDEDDAESCSWDSTDQYPTVIDSDSTNGEEVVIDREYLEEEFDDLDEEDETTSDPVYQKWCGTTGDIGVAKGHYKSGVSVDSTTKEFESLNEMEKNRLFWEACLAS